MVLRRRLYVVAVILVVFIATVMYAFIAQEDIAKDYKGTLVYGQSQEAVA